MNQIPACRQGWLVVMLASVMALLLWQRAPESAQAKDRGQRWEYAELSFDGTASVAAGTKALVTWEDGQRSVTAANFRELGKKLGLPVRRDDSTSMLNAAGGQGWEVTSQSATSWAMSPTSNSGALGQTQYWTLKRPR